jgi:hypothetical protein
MKINPKLVEAVENLEKKEAILAIKEIVQACSMAECRRIYKLVDDGLERKDNKHEHNQGDLFKDYAD